MEFPKEESKQLFTKGDKVLFTGKMLDENVVDKVVTVFYTLGRGEIDDMSDIMDEYTHVYRVWNKDLKHTSKEEPKLQCKDCNTSLEDCTCIEDTIDMKEETLEEAAEKEASLFYEKGSLNWNKYRQVFIEGAKWQQERMYSDEEVFKLLDRAFHMYSSSHRQDAKEWLVEQFKKK